MIPLTEEQKAAAIEAVADKNGVYAIDAIWQAAQSPDHPLHSYYKWDVSEAAIEHWRYVSRKIVASCRINITVNEVMISVPRYVRNPDADGREQGYVRVDRIANDHGRAIQALESELCRTEASLNRSLALSVAFDLQGEFEDMLGRLEGIRHRFNKKAKRKGKVEAPTLAPA